MFKLYCLYILHIVARKWLAMNMAIKWFTSIETAVLLYVASVYVYVYGDSVMLTQRNLIPVVLHCVILHMMGSHCRVK